MKHVLTIDQNQVDQICEPAENGRSYRNVKNSNLLVRISDRRVVSVEFDTLTDGEFEMVKNALKMPVERPFCENDGRSDLKWAETAVKRELEAIGRLHGDNPHMPDSEFWACLIRIASVIKGSGRVHIAPARARTAVLQYAPADLKTKGNREKDIEYLFGRAMNQARPRYRIKGVNQSSIPPYTNRGVHSRVK